MDKFIFRQDYWKCLDNLDSIAKAEAIEDIYKDWKPLQDFRGA